MIRAMLLIIVEDKKEIRTKLILNCFACDACTDPCLWFLKDVELVLNPTRSCLLQEEDPIQLEENRKRSPGKKQLFYLRP